MAGYDGSYSSLYSARPGPDPFLARASAQALAPAWAWLADEKPGGAACIELCYLNQVHQRLVLLLSC